MKITSAKFITGLVGSNTLLEDGTPQVAFIGRSNAGKSSLLNSLTNSKKLAITSNTPGRTKEINVFLINKTHYFLDLPGYGYAKAGAKDLEKLRNLIFWYLLDCKYEQKIVMLIDAVVGPTADDITVLRELEKAGRDLVIVINKIDKVRKTLQKKRVKELELELRGHKLFPYSSKTRVGIQELTQELLSE